MPRLPVSARAVITAVITAVIAAPFDLIDDIGGFFSSLWDGTVGAAVAVWDAIKAVYNFVTTIGDHVASAFVDVYNGLGQLGADVVGFASNVAAAVAHIVDYTIPHALEQAGATVLHAGRVALNVGLHAIEQTAADALHAAERVLRDAIHTVAQAVEAVAKPFAEVYHWFVHVARDAIDLLTHPDRLAQWLLANVFVPLVKLLIEGGEAVARALWQWLLGNAKSVLGEIEALIEAIL